MIDSEMVRARLLQRMAATVDTQNPELPVPGDAFVDLAEALVGRVVADDELDGEQWLAFGLGVFAATEAVAFITNLMMGAINEGRLDEGGRHATLVVTQVACDQLNGLLEVSLRRSE